MKTLLLAESYPMLLASMQQIFAKEGDIDLQGCCRTADQLTQQLAYHEPECLLLDRHIIKGDIRPWLREKERSLPGMRIVLLFPEADQTQFKKVFIHNVKGILLKSADADDMLQAVRDVQAGCHYIFPAIQLMVTDHHLYPRAISSVKLSLRETEVLRLIVEEFTTREIAGKLFLSHCTIETHRLHLIHKLGVKNTAGLVREAVLRHLY